MMSDVSQNIPVLVLHSVEVAIPYAPCLSGTSSCTRTCPCAFCSNADGGWSADAKKNWEYLETTYEDSSTAEFVWRFQLLAMAWVAAGLAKERFEWRLEHPDLPLLRRAPGPLTGADWDHPGSLPTKGYAYLSHAPNAQMYVLPFTHTISQSRRFCSGRDNSNDRSQVVTMESGKSMRVSLTEPRVPPRSGPARVLARETPAGDVVPVASSADEPVARDQMVVPSPTPAARAGHEFVLLVREHPVDPRDRHDVRIDVMTNAATVNRVAFQNFWKPLVSGPTRKTRWNCGVSRDPRSAPADYRPPRREISLPGSAGILNGRPDTRRTAP